ncbi:MAG: hypothetical protein JXD21_05855 [Candidatus Omnitrophica bacterium]|nr:hypothetical protein [Candidatus Omnitrophota bacterium]
MIEKTFRVFTNRDEQLTSEKIAHALLKQETLNPEGSGASYGVIEVREESGPQISDCPECEMLSN